MNRIEVNGSNLHYSPSGRGQIMLVLMRETSRALDSRVACRSASKGGEETPPLLP